MREKVSTKSQPSSDGEDDGPVENPVMAQMPLLDSERSMGDNSRLEKEVEKACTKAFGRIILDKLSEKLQERITILKRENNFQDNGFRRVENDQGQPFVNQVTVKLVEQQEKEGTPKTYTQSFSISKITTFEHLKKVAIHFWAAQKEENNLYFFDENQNIISDETNKTIEKYAQQSQNQATLKANTTESVVLYLMKPKTDNEVSNMSVTNESIKIKGGRKLDGSVRQKKSIKLNGVQIAEQQKEISPEEKFLDEYPGLKQIFKQNKKKEEDVKRLQAEQLKKIRGVGSSSFCTLSVYLILFIISVSLLFGRKDMNETYWNNQVVKKVLDEGPGSFSSVSDLDEVYTFLETKFGDAMFINDVDDESNLRSLNQLVGPLRVRRMLTEETNCQYGGEEAKCYGANYNSDKLTDDLSDQAYDIYQSSTGESSISGDFSSYGGSGYVFDASNSMFLSEWKAQVVAWKAAKFIEPRT